MMTNLLSAIKPYSENLVVKLKDLSDIAFHKPLFKNFHSVLMRKQIVSEEVPNLSYIKALSNSDVEFHNEFLKTLSEEYTTDLRAYLFCIEMGAPRAAAAKVSKLKDKLNILGMKQSFGFAQQHQEKLQKGNKSSDRRFKEILVKTDRFLNRQKQIYEMVN